MARDAEGRKTPHYKITTWEPKIVEDFLAFHGFRYGDIDGDDELWIGKTPSGADAQVAFPKMREELSSGTMRDSVMRHSGFSKKHWDFWRSLRKGDRKKRLCCLQNLD